MTIRTAPHRIQERRESIRLKYRHAVRFRPLSASNASMSLGTIYNISSSGILFASRVMPRIATVMWMKLDYGTLKICEEIDARTVAYSGGILSRIVRIEEDAHTNQFCIGAVFLTKEDGEAQGLVF